MIARLAGTVIDAHAARRTRDPAERARTARWIAGNLLAARGVAVPRGVANATARVIDLHVGTWTALVAAIAASPILVDTSTLPGAWRLALRLVGLPVLDRPVAAALEAGASVGRVVAPARRMLAA